MLLKGGEDRKEAVVVVWCFGPTEVKGIANAIHGKVELHSSLFSLDCSLGTLYEFDKSRNYTAPGSPRSISRPTQRMHYISRGDHSREALPWVPAVLEWMQHR